MLTAHKRVAADWLRMIWTKLRPHIEMSLSIYINANNRHKTQYVRLSIFSYSLRSIRTCRLYTLLYRWTIFNLIKCRTIGDAYLNMPYVFCARYDEPLFINFNITIWGIECELFCLGCERFVVADIRILHETQEENMLFKFHFNETRVAIWHMTKLRLLWAFI